MTFQGEPLWEHGTKLNVGGLDGIAKVAIASTMNDTASGGAGLRSASADLETLLPKPIWPQFRHRGS